MSKLVKINDRKPIEIYIGRKTRGPISGIRLSDAAIARILRSVDAPKDVYAMGPNNALVKLTLDNYDKSEDELFNIKPAPVVEDNEAKAKAEALRKSLEAKKVADTVIVKPEEVKSKVEEPAPKKENDVVVPEPEVQNTEKVEDVKPVTEEVVAPVEEVVAEPAKDENISEVPVEEKTELAAEVKKADTPKNYNNNYNKNYNKNYKNKK